VIVGSGVGHARLGAGARVTECPGCGLVVEALPRRGQNYVTVAVVTWLDLLQHRIAADVAGVRPAAVAAAVRREGLRHATGAIVLVLRNESAGRRGFDDLAAVVEPGVRRQRIR